jgi:hypothetical protein
MKNRVTLALAASVLAGLSLPAFANSSTQGDGTLRSLRSGQEALTSELSARSGYYYGHRVRRGPYAMYGPRYRGWYGAYAYSPGPYGNAPRRAYRSGYSDRPVATGGGTLGYNRSLDNPNY